MLSTTSAQVVKATLPVIGAAIGDITPVFYQRMFAAHPDLERDLFNRGNQAQGDQQSALAGAIAVYATLLVAEDGRDPIEVLARIAHKHASLGITEDQYPIVHEHLFAAIVEVLGDAVTPEVATAWDEVYWHMAHALVTIEKRLYAETGVADGEVWRTLVLRRRLQESPDTVSFVLGTADGSALPESRPGQYVSVQVALPDGAHQIRQYSLTHAPEASEWGISVKAVPAGRRRLRRRRPGGRGVELPAPGALRGRRDPGVGPVRRAGPPGLRGPAGPDLRRHRHHPDHRHPPLPGRHRLAAPGAGAARRPLAGPARPPAGAEGPRRRPARRHAAAVVRGPRRQADEGRSCRPAGSTSGWWRSRPTPRSTCAGRCRSWSPCGTPCSSSTFPRPTSTTRSSGRTSGSPRPERDVVRGRLSSGIGARLRG